jgi:hypothetical protein
MAMNQLNVDCAWESGCCSTAFEEDKFVAAVLEMLMVYGYALFQPNRDGFMPEIADGDQFYIARVGGEWHPIPYDDACRESMRGPGWHLVVHQPPRVARQTNIIGGRGMMWVTMALTSAAARAEIHSRTLDELVLYRRQRNMFNSQPTMFMCEPTAAARATPTNAAWQSLYNPEPTTSTVQDMLLPVGAANTFTELLSERLSRTRATRAHDSVLIADQRRGGNEPGVLPIVPGGLAPAREPDHQAHAELLLSTGLDHTASRHLDGDQHEAWVTRDLMFAVLDAYQVPAGKFGLNRNTERMAGNLIISQQPIYIYRSYVARLLTVLTAVVSACGSNSVLSATPDPSIITTLVPLLEPEVAAQLMDAAYKLSPGSFSAARIEGDRPTDSHAASTPTERAVKQLAAK